MYPPNSLSTALASFPVGGVKPSVNLVAEFGVDRAQVIY
jgi:hypothetical protein